jgi:protein dithiol oxidoreductase (disulfide-forming)
MNRRALMSMIVPLAVGSACRGKQESSQNTGSGSFRGGISGVTWIEGKHFHRVSNQNVVTRAVPSVHEFFWYACPHCFTLEPYLTIWLRGKAATVQFDRVHVTYHATALAHAGLFYTLEVLGRFDLHQAVYEAIFGRGETLAADSEAASLALQMLFSERHGIRGAVFSSAYRSSQVKGLIHRADSLTRLYGIPGTPTIVVNGKFRLDEGTAGGPDYLFALVDDLVAREASATQ